MGKVSDSCTVQSAETVVVTFDMGVPTSSGDMMPELRFNTTNGSSHYAIAESIVLSNPVLVSQTTSGLISSFAGGQILQVTANGLTNDITLGSSEVRICDKPC